ncbi:MAG TPA: DedA family protein [Candidatus Micrarchaeia archaeon]|nr:DedA family protein [Candidatus Micrarchaeia archaeon]
MPSDATLFHLVHTYGYLVIFLAVTAECLGVPFPGDTVMIAGAVWAGAGHLSIGLVILAGFGGAVIGDNCGYLIGRYAGAWVVARLLPLLPFVGRWVHLAQRFFARHGGKTIFIARFVAALRITVPFVAGLSRVRWQRFVAFNLAGGAAWTTSYSLVAFLIGRTFARYTDQISYAGLLVAVIGAVAVLLLFTLGQNWLERWLLAEEPVAAVSAAD